MASVSAVYRIDVEHRPQDGPTFPTWYATAIRISDGYPLASGSGDTPEQAAECCREALVKALESQDSVSIYLDDELRPVPADDALVRVERA